MFLNDEERNLIPEGEAIEKLKKAVFITKGLCNNSDGMRIAKCKNSTVEDIVRLGSWSRLETSTYARPLQGSPRGEKSDYDFSARVSRGRKVMLKDTVTWKYIKAKGLEPLAMKYNLHQRTTNDVRSRFSGCCRQQLEMVMNFAKMSEFTNIASDYPVLGEQLCKVAHYDLPIEHTGDPAWEDYYNGRKEFYKAEIDWLSHAPTELLENLNQTNKSYASMTECLWNMRGTIMELQQTNMTAYKAREYAREMAKLMKYMGIGVAGVGGYSWGLVRNRKNTQALAKYIMTVKNKFSSMVKKGFEVEVVREEVVNMLNAWVATKCIIAWKFYVRTDAPTEYPDLKSEAKVHKLHRSGSASPSIVTVEDAEAKIVKTADGTEIKFNRKVAQ